MRTFSVVLSVLCCVQAPAPAQHSLEKIWESEAVLKFPEGLVLEPGGQFLYVTNTDGNPLEKDGRGSIGKIGLDGRVITADWVTGLDAPKGLARHGDLLYAADLDQVVVVDARQGTIVRRIPVSGARLLHNVAIDAAGIVYVSDMFTGKIHRIDGQAVSTYLDSLTSPAGIVFSGSDLYVFTGAGLVRIDAAKHVTTVSRNMDGRANGIVMVQDHEFIVTSWGGLVYYVNRDGTNQVLLDTSAQGIAAGINLYDPKNATMYMTTDQHNTVIAYRVR